MNISPDVDAIIIPQPGINNSVNVEEKPVKVTRQCPICHVHYTYGNSYWQHVRYVHAKSLSQCVICEKSYKRTTMAKHHILQSHKIAWHLCSNYVRKIKKNDVPENREVKSEIDNRARNVRYFKKKTLHLISRFNCYNCHGSFATIGELFKHVKSHSGEESSKHFQEYMEEDEDIEERNFNESDSVTSKINDDISNTDVVKSSNVVSNVNENESQNELESAKNYSIDETNSSFNESANTSENLTQDKSFQGVNKFPVSKNGNISENITPNEIKSDSENISQKMVVCNNENVGGVVTDNTFQNNNLIQNKTENQTSCSNEENESLKQDGNKFSYNEGLANTSPKTDIKNSDDSVFEKNSNNFHEISSDKNIIDSESIIPNDSNMNNENTFCNNSDSSLNINAPNESKTCMSNFMVSQIINSFSSKSENNNDKNDSNNLIAED